MKLKEFMGWEIEVDDDGRFTAKNGKARLSRKDLGALEREIASRSSARVEVMRFELPSWGTLPTMPPKKVVLVRAESGGRIRDEKGGIVGSHGWAAFDQRIVDGVAAFIEKREALEHALEAEYAAWVGSLGVKVLTPADILRLLAGGGA